MAPKSVTQPDGDARDELASGAARVKSLLAAIAAISDATCCSLDEGEEDTLDGRDYVAMTEVIQASLLAITGGSADFRKGASRALADVLADAADGGAFDESWDPLATSEPAFRRRWMQSLGSSAAA